MINKVILDYIKKSYNIIKFEIYNLKNLKIKKDDEKYIPAVNKILLNIIDNCDSIYYNIKRLNLIIVEFDYHIVINNIQLIISKIKIFKNLIKEHLNSNEEKKKYSIDINFDEFYNLFSKLLTSFTIKSNLLKSINFSFDNFNNTDDKDT